MAIGNVAGDVVTTGANNVSIGINTDPSANNGNQQLAIGYGAIGKGDNTGFVSANGGANYAGNNSADWSTTDRVSLETEITGSRRAIELEPRLSA